MAAIQVFVWRLSESLSDDGWRVLSSQLPKAKQDHAHRFKSPSRWRSFVAVHALFEHASNFVGGDGHAAYRTTYGADWELPSHSLLSRCYCGFSHSATTVACALSSRGMVGIDIEVLNAKERDYPSLVEAFFSSREKTLFNQLSVTERSEFFLRRWTLKESLLKARGQGISSDGLRRDFLPDPEIADHQVQSGYQSIGFYFNDLIGALTIASAATRDVQYFSFDYPSQGFSEMHPVAESGWLRPK